MIHTHAGLSLADNAACSCASPCHLSPLRGLHILTGITCSVFAQGCMPMACDALLTENLVLPCRSCTSTWKGQLLVLEEAEGRMRSSAGVMLQ